MWDMLIVLLVAIVIWFCGSSIFFNTGKSSLNTAADPISTTVSPPTPNGTNAYTTNGTKPRSIVDAMTERASQQVDNSRQAQQQEMQEANNNN